MLEFVATWLVLFVSSTLLVVYSYLKWNKNYWKRKGIFYDPPHILFGSLKSKFTGEKHYAQILYDLYRKYSNLPFVGLYRLTTPAILIREPELIKEVLVKSFPHFHDNDFPNRPGSDPILSRNPFLLTGEEWKTTRGRLTPGFTNLRVKTVFDNMLAATKELKEYLLKHPENLDTKEISAKFTTEVVAKAIFGIDGNSFVNEEAEFRSMGTNVVANDVLSCIKITMIEFVPFIANLLQLRIFPKKVVTFFEKLVNESMEFRKKNKIERNDFFGLLMQLHDKHPEFDMQEMTSHSVLFFNDGFETSSTAMGMCLYELAKNPRLQEKARAEVDAAIEKHGGLTFEAVTESLPYVENCLNESMRLYPPVTYMQRLCTKPLELKSESGETVTIEEGMSTIMCILGLHHDEKYFPEPMVYRPERFAEEKSNERHRYAYLPFGEGPRICLAIKFGQTQTKLGIAFILRNFNIIATDKTPKSVHLSKFTWLMMYLADQAPYVTFQERKNIPGQIK